MHQSLRAPIALCVLALLVLSGCTSKSQPQTTESSPTAPAPEVNASQGSIAGLVTDDQIVPLVGVQAGILNLGLEARSDKDGRFTFNNLDPGTYAVAFNKFGYQAKAQNVAVSAGVVANLNVMLAPIPTQAPHYVTYDQSGVLKCSFRWYPGAPTAGLLGLPPTVTGLAACGVNPVNSTIGDKFLLHFVTDPGPQELLLEMDWVSTQAFGKGLSTVLEVDGQPNNLKATYGNAVGVSPIHVYANKTKMDEVDANSGADCAAKACKVWTRSFASANTTGIRDPAQIDVGVVFDQAFRNHLTAFYYMSKPDGFTVLQSG